jgi:hypothetical protein
VTRRPGAVDVADFGQEGLSNMGEGQDDKPRRRPRGEDLIDLEGLADRWGLDDLEELKRLIRSGGVPFFSLGKVESNNVRWDRVRFRLEAIRRWEAENEQIYSERKAGPRSVVGGAPISLIRQRGLR